MISVDNSKQTSVSSSSLSLTTETQEKGGSSLSFSELLKSVSSNKDDKEIQNGALILSLVDTKDAKISKDTKVDTLLSLLKGEVSIDEDLELVEINPKLTSALSIDELKGLIKDAKEYLKGQILQSVGFKKSEIQALPKTLKGLAAVATKFDIDISKITIEEVQANGKIAQKGEAKISIPEAKVVINTQEKETVKEDVKNPKGELGELLKKDFKSENRIAKKTDIREESKSVEVKRIDIKDEPKSGEVKKSIVPRNTHKVDVKPEEIEATKKEIKHTQNEVIVDDIEVKAKVKNSKSSISLKQTQEIPDDVKHSEQIKTETNRQDRKSDV